MGKMEPNEATRDNVFIAGGQPSVTYVDRAHLQIEESLKRALKVPNQVVSLAGPTKSGKTVLCRTILAKSPYIWLEGGQLQSSSEIWDRICYVLNYPVEVTKTGKSEVKGGITVGPRDWLSIDGSLLRGSEAARTYKIDSMSSALRYLKEQKLVLVVDDFHYLSTETRKTFLRNIKGPVYDGLKLVLLSVSHRGLDAVKAESELQGRVYSVVMPDWTTPDLREIASKGFSVLNIACAAKVVERLAIEAQASPFLMQKLCWEVCAGIGVDERPTKQESVGENYDIVPICVRLSKDFGHPIYQKLEVGPSSRKQRRKRVLRHGGTADIYRIVLMAMAAAGPTAKIDYDTLRQKISELLAEDPPQKNEITSALKHLATISQRNGNDAGIDWDGEERKIDISDPYLRFYLRWQIRPVAESSARSERLGIRILDPLTGQHKIHYFSAKVTRFVRKKRDDS